MSLETTKKEVSQSSFTYSTTVPKRDNRGSCHNSRFTTLWQTSAKFSKLGGEQLSALARHVDWYLGGRRVLTGAGFLICLETSWKDESPGRENTTPFQFSTAIPLAIHYTAETTLCMPTIYCSERQAGSQTCTGVILHVWHNYYVSRQTANNCSFHCRPPALISSQTQLQTSLKLMAQNRWETTKAPTVLKWLTNTYEAA